MDSSSGIDQGPFMMAAIDENAFDRRDILVPLEAGLENPAYRDGNKTIYDCSCNRYKGG